MIFEELPKIRGDMNNDLITRDTLLINPENWQDWLAAPREKVDGLVAACPDEGLQAWPVGRRVSKVVDDDAGLIALAVLGA